MKTIPAFLSCLAVLILAASLVPAACAAGDGETMTRAELSAAILPYMEATYCGENVVHLAPIEIRTAACRFLGLPEPPENTEALRIATPNVVKATNFYDDYYVGIFTHLSNLPMMRMDANGHLVGLTADRYEVSSDNTQWTFYLKDDLFWSDGRRVTPEDVAFSFEYLGEHEPDAGWIKETLVGTTVSDEENAVTFTFNKPYTTINLEFATYNILPKHIWEHISDPNEYTEAGPFVGDGPYYLEEIDLNAAKMTFRKNHHWQGKQPAFGTVEVHWFANDDAAALALEAGDVDTYYRYANSYPYAGVQRLKDTGEFNTLEKTSIGLTFLAPNLKRAPMNDLSFREALADAINYDELVAVDTLGYGTVPNRGFVPPGMDYFADTPALAYDPVAARQILHDAGYLDTDGNGIVECNGTDLDLDLLVRTGFERDGQLIEEYLEDVGIGATVHQVDSTTWFSLKDEYDYDLTVTGTTPWGMLMHAGWGTGYFDSRRTGKGVLHNLDDPVYLALCDNILATSDQAQLERYAGEMQAYFDDNLPAIALYWKKDVIPYNRAYTGWYYEPLFGIYDIETFLNVRAASG
ncbi:MAG: peptide/nickel transport system substrate-binding protein [Methanofollis sp.]|nr:peptide/nickel transport system substrate-binding protein [Methanofollis sp.]